MATTTLNKGIETLLEVFANAKELELNSMYTNSVFSEASQTAYAATVQNRKLYDAFAGDTDTKTRRQLKHEQDKAKFVKNVGTIVCTTTPPVLHSDWPPGETPICPATLRDGSKGCTRGNCTENHAKIGTWSKALIKCMISHVDKFPDLIWKQAVATPDILGSANHISSS